MKQVLLAVFLLILSSSLFAWTIGPMNYQGRLVDGAGIPVGYPTPTTASFVVNIWDAPTGGNLKYSEQQNNITVSDGTYSFLVSTGVTTSGSWDIYLWNTPSLYLEMVVNGQTMTPRHLLASTPFAYQANLALTTNNALALGGKSSGQVLQDICKAGKGKWLELANQGAGTCLGIASSFPGPTQVNINTLTASKDFTNLDLTNADISGINFGAVDFTGSILKNTIVKGGSFTGANFTNSIWDGVTTTTAMTVNFNMRRAQMKNMSLALFSFTDVTKLNYLSAGFLSACPAALPASYQWACRVQTTSPTTVYQLVGYDYAGTNLHYYEGINYSLDSAFVDNSAGIAHIKVDDFNNTNAFGADFRSMYIDQSFVGTSYGYADFSGADIWRVDFSAASNGDSSIFDKAKLHAVNFSNPVTRLLMTSVSFVGTVLDNVSFRNVDLESVSFTNATLTNADFTNVGDNGAGLYFNGAYIYSAKFWKIPNTISIDFTNAKFVGGGPGSIATFWNSSLYWMSFAGARFTDMVFDNTVTMTNTSTPVNFTNTVWVNPYFGNSAATSPIFTGVNFQGAHFYETTASLWTNIPVANWAGARCPDGYLIGNPNTLSVRCNVGHLLP